MNHRALDLAFDIAPSLNRSIFSVMAFTVIALGLYAYASYELHHEAHPLASKCHDLEEKLRATRVMTKELSEMVASLSDPAADEYALVTELGRIPEGSRKVLLNPTTLKNREFANAKDSRFDSEKSGLLLEIGADFAESKMLALAKAKTDSSAGLGLHPTGVCKP